MSRSLAIPPGTGKAGAFTPASLTGLGAWYKADALALSNGAAVTSWADSGSGGFTATQATGAKQPTFQTAQVNGLPAVLFNVTNHQYLTSGADTTFASGCTLFAVVNPTVVNIFQAIVGPSSTNGFEYLLTTAGKQRISGPTLSATATTAQTAGAWTRFSVDYDASSAFHFFNKGTADGNSTVALATTGTNTMVIGAHNAGVTQWWSGYIAEIITYGRVLNGTERGQVDTYLSAKYGF